VYYKNGTQQLTLNNISEIHYNYDARKRIAFESDLDSTGYTYDLNDIIEFEAKKIC